MEKPLVLVVDDQEKDLYLLQANLHKLGYRTLATTSGDEGLKLIETENPDIALTDLMMPEINGYEMCKKVKEMTKNEKFLPIILLTSQGDKESIVKGLEMGADDYVTKPFDIDELHARIRAMLRIRDLKQELFQKDIQIKKMSKELADKRKFQHMVGNTLPMQDVFEKMRMAAMVTSPVIVNGESGTGKEMVAKGIHYSSPLAEGPFVAVNCAALPSELIESELFGHKKGAFTGAMTASQGLFKAADGGTIFLDEITEMPTNIQAKLLRVLQENTVRMVGGTEELPITARVIAATNRNIEQAIKDDKMREDLYYRLSVLTINLPPLRTIKEDIPLLAQNMVGRFNQKFGREIKGFTAPALQTLALHTWPGNVRELQNVVERCYAIPDIEVIDTEHVQMNYIASPPVAAPAAEEGNAGDVLSLDEAEKRLIVRTLEKTGYNKQKTAKLLGIHRSRLYKKLERYGISG